MTGKGQIRVTLEKSIFGQLKSNIASVRGLGCAGATRP
jgi:hypothetical protein